MSEISKGFHPFGQQTLRARCPTKKSPKVLKMMMKAAKLGGGAEQEQDWGTSRVGAGAGQCRSGVELGTG